jgi:hypothetical protein
MRQAARREVARMLHDLGYPIVATKGTAAAIEAAGVPVKVVNKVKDGRPHIVDMIKNGEIALVHDGRRDAQAIADSRSIRMARRRTGHVLHHHRRRARRWKACAPEESGSLRFTRPARSPKLSVQLPVAVPCRG